MRKERLRRIGLQSQIDSRLASPVGSPKGTFMRVFSLNEATRPEQENSPKASPDLRRYLKKDESRNERHRLLKRQDAETAEVNPDGADIELERLNNNNTSEL